MTLYARPPEMIPLERESGIGDRSDGLGKAVADIECGWMTDRIDSDHLGKPFSS